MSAHALHVFVSGRAVARLTSDDGFEHHLTYLPDAHPADFVSLVMPVRPQSWSWPTLHPFFQINLPEGFLLSVLKEQLGPHLGARPLDLLAVVGRNTIGHVQLAPGDSLDVQQAAIDLDALLHGEHSADAFMDLVRTHAASGVSGVAPKFLSPETRALFRKTAVATERYIVKGSAERLPFLALNEHLGMTIARRAGARAANTEVSDDGQVLVVERFDIAGDGTRRGFEDCCSLLGLTPDEKYDSTWERVSRLVGTFVAPEQLTAAHEQMALTLLLTLAIGNADCHTKNLALLYSNERDAELAPVYDMLSIAAYDSYADNPPGMYVGGRKSWDPGKALWLFMQQSLGIEPAYQRTLVERVCGAVADTFPELLEWARELPAFAPVASRIAHEWNEGFARLAPHAGVVVPDFVSAARANGLEPTPAERRPRRRLGESPLLGKRRPAPAS